MNTTSTPEAFAEALAKFVLRLQPLALEIGQPKYLNTSSHGHTLRHLVNDVACVVPPNDLRLPERGRVEVPNRFWVLLRRDDVGDQWITATERELGLAGIPVPSLGVWSGLATIIGYGQFRNETDRALRLGEMTDQLASAGLLSFPQAYRLREVLVGATVRDVAPPEAEKVDIVVRFDMRKLATPRAEPPLFETPLPLCEAIHSPLLLLASKPLWSLGPIGASSRPALGASFPLGVQP